MVTERTLIIDFGVAGNSPDYLGDGWARAESGFTWAVDTQSQIMLPRLADADEYLLTLDVIPFVHPPELPAQRLIVSINDTVVGSTPLARPTLLGYRIPGALIKGGAPVTITLRHPDAARPSEFSATADDRLLAFSLPEARLYRSTSGVGAARCLVPVGTTISSTGGGFGPRPPMGLAQWVQHQTGLDMSRLAMSFESLGENCEFGLVQRRCDAEPLGLLRFSSTFMRNLIRGLDAGFEGLAEGDDVDVRLEGAVPREYMIYEKKFGLLYHTFIYEGEHSIWLMREQESARLKYLRREFTEDLKAGDKIYVYKRVGPVADEEILPLLLALRQHGGNTLLWVALADKDHPVGSVEVAMPGLLKGYVDRFAPEENAHDLSFDAWVRVCANAYLLSRLSKGGA